MIWSSEDLTLYSALVSYHSEFFNFSKAETCPLIASVIAFILSVSVPYLFINSVWIPINSFRALVTSSIEEPELCMAACNSVIFSL